MQLATEANNYEVLETNWLTTKKMTIYFALFMQGQSCLSAQHFRLSPIPNMLTLKAIKPKDVGAEEAFLLGSTRQSSPSTAPQPAGALAPLQRCQHVQAQKKAARALPQGSRPPLRLRGAQQTHHEIASSVAKELSQLGWLK